MLDKELLVEKLKIKGFTLESFASELGVNYTTLYRKLNGDSEFTRPEIKLAKRVLNLNNSDVDAIFFSD